MKKHLSVWMLLNRASLLPLAGVCAVCAAAQYLLFCSGMKTQTFLAKPGLETAFAQSHMGKIAALGLVLVLAVLTGCACNTSARSDYTICRLRISETAFCFWHAAHAAAGVAVFWAVQLATALLCANTYLTQYDPAGVQTLLLACWRQPFLHSLLPVLDPLRWVRNLLLLAALALAAADFARRRRRGGRGYWLVVLTAAALALFSGTPEALFNDALLLILCAAAVWCLLANLLHAEDKEGDDETI